MRAAIRTLCIFPILALAACNSQPPAPLATTTAPQPTPTAAAKPAWYESEIQAFEAADRASPPVPGQVLFTGSSSVRLWSTLARDMAPAPILNRGFGGSKTHEVLEVFDRVVLPYKPSVIVYYCGDNDLGTDNTNAEAAAQGFITFDQRARALWPDIPVFYIAIKPSVQRWANWPAMNRANNLVRDYCHRTPGATFLDTATPTLLADGKPDPSIFNADGLHLNAKGYAIWTTVIREPVLAAWKKTSASPAAR